MQVVMQHLCSLKGRWGILIPQKKVKKVLKLHQYTLGRPKKYNYSHDVVYRGLMIRQWWDADSFRCDA